MTTAELRDQTNLALGERVHTLMWRRRITQTALAELLGIDQSALNKKLRGSRPWYAHEVQAVANLLQTSVAALYGEQSLPEPDPRTPVGVWAPRGSNPEPTGLTYPQLSGHLRAA